MTKKIGKLTRISVFRLWALEIGINELVVKTGLPEGKLRELLKTIPDGRLLPGTLAEKLVTFKTYERTGKPARIKMIKLPESTAPSVAAPAPVVARADDPPPETPEDLLLKHREDWQSLRPLIFEAIETRSKDKAYIAKTIAETFRITHDGERLAHGLPTASGAAQGNKGDGERTLQVVIVNDPDKN